LRYIQAWLQQFPTKQCSPLVPFHFSRRHVISLTEFSHRSSLLLLARCTPCKKQKAGPWVSYSTVWGPGVALSSTCYMSTSNTTPASTYSCFNCTHSDYKTKSMAHKAAWDVDGISVRNVIPRPCGS